MKSMVLMIMLVLLTMGNAEAKPTKEGIRDVIQGIRKWHKGTENVRKNARKKRKKTTEGVKKTTKKVTKGIKKTTKIAKVEWDKREKPCVRCGKMTRLGNLCADCKRKAIAATGREIGKQGKKVVDTTKKGAQNAGKFTSERYNEWSPVVESTYKEVLSNVRDPEQRAKMKKGLIKTTKIASQIQQAKKRGVYLGLSKVTSLKLPGNLGGKTLGEEMGERLIKMNPGLAGMGIAEDPALALTAVILLDRRSFTHDLKLIKRDGRNVSLAESVEMSSPFNSSGAIKGLKAIAATERLATGEGDVGDLIDLGNAMN